MVADPIRKLDSHQLPSPIDESRWALGDWPPIQTRLENHDVPVSHRQYDGWSRKPRNGYTDLSWSFRYVTRFVRLLGVKGSIRRQKEQLAPRVGGDRKSRLGKLDGGIKQYQRVNRCASRHRSTPEWHDCRADIGTTQSALPIHS